jgi:DNA modification methylase
MQNQFFEEEEQEETIEVFEIALSEIKPHPTSLSIYDYKKNSKDIKVLAKTIEAVGQLEPIVINQENLIISGNRRYRALLFLGKKTIKAIRTDTTKNEGDKIVFHNQQRKKTTGEIIREAESILGTLGVNQGKRRDLIGDKPNSYGTVGKDRFEIAAKVIGDISASSLRRIMDVVAFEKETEENKNIGLIERVVKGDLTANRAHTMMKSIMDERKVQKKLQKQSLNPIANDDFTIFNKSSEKMDDVKSDSVQVVFTSPPYFNLRNYGNSTEDKNELGHETTPQQFVKNLAKHFKDVKRVLKKEGSFFLNIGETYSKGENLLIPTRLLLEMCDKEGWFIVNEIIWRKTNPMPLPNSKRLQPTYEKIFHLVKDIENYIYHEFSIKTDEEIKVVKSPAGRNTTSTERTESGYTLARGVQKFKDFIEEHQIGDVITGPNAANRQVELQRIDPTKDHPALMPEYLPLLPILTTSKIGDIVLDPFSGSATTGKTALLLGRKYIGYELNKDNFDLSLVVLNEVVSEIKKKEK